MKRPIIGVMGGSDGVAAEHLATAYRLGQLIARNGWILLNGGRNVGVMDACALQPRRHRLSRWAWNASRDRTCP